MRNGVSADRSGIAESGVGIMRNECAVPAHARGRAVDHLESGDESNEYAVRRVGIGHRNSQTDCFNVGRHERKQGHSLAAALLGLILAGEFSLMCDVALASTIRVTTGSFGDMVWRARSVIVSTSSTAALASGGNPVYVGAMPQYSGTVALIMNYGPVGSFLCSGALLPDRRSILTAAHCVSDAVLSRPTSTTAYFYGGPDPDTVVPSTSAATSVSISDYFVHAAYTGEVIDENDIAVLRLVDEAPGWATSYDLYEPGGGGLRGRGVNLAGYGRRSDTGGTLGDNLSAGRLRQGDNRFDFRFGDSDFSGFWDGFFGAAPVNYSYVVDFDSGLAANDASCLLAGTLFLGGAKYCNVGAGILESVTAGGDSGGPNFIGDSIASVTSFILSFGAGFGDVDGSLNSSFGEFGGFVPVYRHLNFVRDHMVRPEGSTLASLSLKTAVTAGCKSVTGTVRLSVAAPSEGTSVTLSDTLASASVPVTLKISPGTTTKTFSVKTVPVSTTEVGTIKAALGGKTLSQSLTVRPMGLLGVTLQPTTVVGTQPANGAAKLECRAGPGPIAVDLSSSKHDVAFPVATSIIIPQGVQSQAFKVATDEVLSKTYAMITAEANGTTKSRKLNVTPAAEVSPRSLRFDNVTVGTTSGALSTTLANKGTSAFFVDSISITGSYASWFSQTNNCPSSLPAGGSCTFTVKVKPALVAKKSAKLTITTSATSMPLSVSLSGTGI